MQVEQKKLGAFDIYTLGVGGAIGSGIFVMMGSGIAYTGRSIVLAVSIGCLYMLLAYLFHPIMSSMFVLPGGDYDMKAMLLGPTMTGFSALNTVVGSLGMASYSIAFASYFTSVFTSLADYQPLISMILTVIFFAFSIRGTKALAVLTSIITVILLVSIVVFIAIGTPQVQPGYWSNADGGFWLDGFGGFIGAIAMMSFACQGSTMGPVSVMPVTKNARRVIPITILVITLTVGIAYGLMAYVASGVLPLDQVAGQNLSVVAQAIFNPVLFAVFILGAACCAIMSSFSSGMTQIRYPLQAVANDGWLPSVFKKTTKSGYPYVVMGMYLIFSFIPLFTSLCGYAYFSGHDSFHVHQCLHEYLPDQAGEEVSGSVEKFCPAYALPRICLSMRTGYALCIGRSVLSIYCARCILHGILCSYPGCYDYSLQSAADARCSQKGGTTG